MAGSAAVLEDSSLLSRLDRALLPVERFCALISGLAIFSLMFLAAYSVTGRKFFASPLAGYVDYIEAAMPVIAIMGVSYVQRDGTHIRMDMLVSALKGRVLWLFELLSVLMILVLMMALTWGAWEHFDRSFDCARPLCSRDSSVDIGIPDLALEAYCSCGLCGVVSTVAVAGGWLWPGFDLWPGKPGCRTFEPKRGRAGKA